MTELLREPSRVVIDEIMNRPRGPSAEVLSDTYGQSAAENQLYGQLLKGAYEGTLGFDPIENVKDFARAADSVEESSGVGDIEIPVEQGVDSTDKASLSTILKATQQVRLARSLGYISPGRARIENGKLKVRIVRPGNNSEKGLFPKFQDGKYVDHKDAVDPEGQNIPADVVDSAQANLFVRCMDENYGIRLNITDEIKQIINQAARNKVSMPVQLVARGAVPFYRAIAEALGYHTGPLEPDIGPDGKELYGHYKIPVINRRPGFDSTAQTRSEMASPSNSTEGQEPENNQEYLGPKRNISPNILRLVTGPDSLTDLERKEALNRAQREAGLDAAQNRVVLTDGEGNEYWGAEYPNIFTANEQIRGKFDEIPRDLSKRTTAMELTSDLGGKYTHVIVELDNGEKVMIHKTSGDAKSAKLQTFELVSTKGAKNGRPKIALGSEKLAELVIVPGERLTINGTVSEAMVSRITTANISESGRVTASQKSANKVVKVKRDTLGRFNRDLEVAS